MRIWRVMPRGGPSTRLPAPAGWVPLRLVRQPPTTTCSPIPPLLSTSRCKGYFHRGNNFIGVLVPAEVTPPLAEWDNAAEWYRRDGAAPDPVARPAPARGRGAISTTPPPAT